MTRESSQELEDVTAFTISVIIPTLNEEQQIAEVVARTRALGTCEIIVVDGGSTDATVVNAQGADRCLTAPRGRAGQQNQGANASRGDVLLFLHADCWLEPGGFEEMRAALADERCVGGCFRQAIDAAGIRYRLLERGNAARVRWWSLPYGDQGIFVRRAVFERIGGFPDMELMDDLFFVCRLRREGRIALVDAKLHVSPRRWQRAGVIRQTLKNWSLVALAQCGVSPNRLARFYPPVR